MFEKKEIAKKKEPGSVNLVAECFVSLKKNKLYLTNLVVENSSWLSPRESERVKVARNASQALCTHSVSDFKAAVRMSLMRDNKVTTEDVALTEKTFGPDVGGLKGMTTRSKPLLTQSQVMGIPRELLSLYEEAQTSLDGSCVNGKLLATSISHEIH